jgi:transcriptional regulator with XRE-family HTH domain
MKLSRWMKKNGKSAADVCREAGLAKAALSRFLNGGAMLSAANCEKLIDLTDGDVSLKDLLAESGAATVGAEAP